jgi:hypothetical protein
MPSIDEQALDYSKKKLEEYQSRQSSLDDELNASFDAKAAARRELKAAQTSGDAAAIAAAQRNFDDATNRLAQADADQANNLKLIDKTEQAVSNNTRIVEQQQAAGNAQVSPPTSVTDPAVEQAQARSDAVATASPKIATPESVNTQNNPELFQQQTNASVLNAIQTQPVSSPPTVTATADGGGNAFVAQTNAGVLGAIGAGGSTITDGASGRAAEQAGTPSAGAGFSVTANGQQSVEAKKAEAQAQQAAQQRSTFRPAADWRVRISLAPSATYLYKAKDPGILQPLIQTNGVIFPYTPTISVGYSASYNAETVTHSNYKLLSYQGSAVDNVSIGGEFTAQDSAEANYLLAVIHFFRSCTKMFYGQDTTPVNGTPPPLVYLNGFGAYQFDNHPMVITGFTLQLPNDVDYIRATGPGSARANITQKQNPSVATSLGVIQRLFGSKLGPGGISQEPVFRNLDASAGGTGAEVTYVPTKISLSIQASPIVTRNDISNNFSLRDYASGKLLRGSQRVGTGVVSGGIW